MVVAGLPDRFCEICGATHQPPIHVTQGLPFETCYPGKYGGRVYFSKLPDLDDPAAWPSKEELKSAAAYWDAVFTDKGMKPLS